MFNTKKGARRRHMTDLKHIISKLVILHPDQIIDISPFKSVEDGEDYEVWSIKTKSQKYVLKKAKNYEIEVYSSFLDGISAPRFIESVNVDGDNYFITEFFDGADLCSCDRQSLKKALDALIYLQNKFWNNNSLFNAGYSFEKSLERRIERGKFLNDSRLESAYSDYLSLYKSLPKTLCHDDLLPFNVLVNDRGAMLIDWEFAGILPYPTSLARLLAHAEEKDGALFFMRDDDKAFAIDYYYENLLSDKGIPREEYESAISLFLFYEYCEWIMLGNKYEDADMELYAKYLAKASDHLSKISLNSGYKAENK